MIGYLQKRFLSRFLFVTDMGGVARELQWKESAGGVTQDSQLRGAANPWAGGLGGLGSGPVLGNADLRNKALHGFVLLIIKPSPKFSTLVTVQPFYYVVQ